MISAVALSRFAFIDLCLYWFEKWAWEASPDYSSTVVELASFIMIQWIFANFGLFKIFFVTTRYLKVILYLSYRVPVLDQWMVYSPY